MRSHLSAHQFAQKHLQRCSYWKFLSLAVFVLPGCGGPTAKDFTTIKVGMPLTEVEQILGTGIEVLKDDPELPGIYIPTPQERLDSGAPNERWIKWVIDGHYILVGVDRDEVFMVNRDKSLSAPDQGSQ